MKRQSLGLNISHSSSPTTKITCQVKVRCATLKYKLGRARALEQSCHETLLPTRCFTMMVWSAWPKSSRISSRLKRVTSWLDSQQSMINRDKWHRDGQFRICLCQRKSLMTAIAIEASHLIALTWRKTRSRNKIMPRLSTALSNVTSTKKSRSKPPK